MLHNILNFTENELINSELNKWSATTTTIIIWVRHGGGAQNFGLVSAILEIRKLECFCTLRQETLTKKFYLTSNRGRKVGDPDREDDAQNPNHEPIYHNFIYLFLKLHMYEYYIISLFLSKKNTRHLSFLTPWIDKLVHFILFLNILYTLLEILSTLHDSRWTFIY